MQTDDKQYNQRAKMKQSETFFQESRSKANIHRPYESE